MFYLPSSSAKPFTDDFQFKFKQHNQLSKYTHVSMCSLRENHLEILDDNSRKTTALKLSVTTFAKCSFKLMINCYLVLLMFDTCILFFDHWYHLLFSSFCTWDAMAIISGHLVVTTDSFFMPFARKNRPPDPPPPVERTITSYLFLCGIRDMVRSGTAKVLIG